MTISRALLVVALATCGCTSSSGDGRAFVTGTFGGFSFDAADSVAFVDGPSARIFISTSPNICDDIANNKQRANTDVLVMLVATTNGDALGPGTYSTEDQSALFECNATDQVCNVSSLPAPDGTGTGTITITDVSGGTVTGMFDMTMEDGQHVTGSFSPSSCPEIADEASDPTCSP